MTTTHPTRQMVLPIALLAALISACSEESEPDQGQQGTAGAAFVPDSGSTPDAIPPDQLATREEICAHEPPSGGLPVRHCPCEKLTCGEPCDPCMGCSGPLQGCVTIDGGIYRCNSGDVCTQTVD